MQRHSTVLIKLLTSTYYEKIGGDAERGKRSGRSEEASGVQGRVGAWPSPNFTLLARTGMPVLSTWNRYNCHYSQEQKPQQSLRCSYRNSAFIQHATLCVLWVGHNKSLILPCYDLWIELNWSVLPRWTWRVVTCHRLYFRLQWHIAVFFRNDDLQSGYLHADDQSVLDTWQHQHNNSKWLLYCIVNRHLHNVSNSINQTEALSIKGNNVKMSNSPACPYEPWLHF